MVSFGIMVWLRLAAVMCVMIIKEYELKGGPLMVVGLYPTGGSFVLHPLKKGWVPSTSLKKFELEVNLGNWFSC